MSLYYLYRLTRLELFGDLTRFAKQHGLREVFNLASQYRPDTPWITNHVTGAGIEPDFLPDNVTITGPIVLSTAPAKGQDPELYKWLSRPGRRTMLINLGTLVLYDAPQASAMVAAVETILSEQPDLQVIWKYPRDPSGNNTMDDNVGPVRKFVESDRLRLTDWLTVDPGALVDSGRIAVSVHHGGAGIFFEALA
jgi:hypothetical protein